MATQVAVKSGDRFGLLEALEAVAPRFKGDGRRRHAWRVRCDCGAVFEVEVLRLSGGQNRPLRSCGHESWAQVALSEIQLAYLAGLIDGEGCISLRRDARASGAGYRYNGGLGVGMTDPAIRRLAREVGLGRLSKRRPQRPGWKACHVWHVGSRECRRLLPSLLPFLRFKKRQAELMIQYLRLADKVNRLDKNNCAEHMAAAERVYRRLRQLNQKGS